jgi:ribosomal subunit interface protein
MKISVAKRRTQSGDALQEYAIEKIEHLNHYFPDGIISVDVVLDAEKGREIVGLVAHLIRRKIIKASAESDNLHAAIDAATEKLKTQLVRYKEQLQDKKFVARPQEEPKRADHQEGELLRTTVYLRKPMTPEEAILQLESYQKKDFLIFMDVERESLSILHRLKNGQYELIEPVL